MPCLLLLIVVYRWGRRHDIYIAGAFFTMLIWLDYQLEQGWTFRYNLVDEVLPFVLLWVMVWLLAQQRTLQDQLMQQHRSCSVMTGISKNRSRHALLRWRPASSSLPRSFAPIPVASPFPARLTAAAWKRMKLISIWSAIHTSSSSVTHRSI